MKTNNIVNNIKLWLIFWLSASLVFLLTWVLYSEWKEMKTVFNGDTLESVEWNKIVNNVNELKTLVYKKYSTSEQFTWEYWLDWKPIYRQTYQFTVTQTTNAQEIVIDSANWREFI